MKPNSQYSIHLWPSTILNLKDRQLIRGDPRPPVHANGRPVPWTHAISLCNLSAECSDDVHFRQNCIRLPCLVASFSYYCYFKAPTVYPCGCLSVPGPTCVHSHTTVRTAGAWPAALGCFAGWIHTSALCDCTIVI